MSQNFFRKIIPFYCSLMLALAACGGGSSSLSPDADLGVLSPTEQMIFSKYYAGELVVYLDDEIKAQVTTGKSLSVLDDNQQKQAQQLQNVVNAYAQAELKSLSNDFSALTAKSAAVQHERSSKYFKALTGKDRKDFRNVLKIEIKDAVQAVRLLREIKRLSFVKLAYPNAEDVSSGMMDSVPELIGFQQYLEPLQDAQGNFLGGLNIIAARQQYQVQSAPDLWVVDEEKGMYSRHPDLELSSQDFSQGGSVLGGNFICDPYILENSAPSLELNDALGYCPGKIEHGAAVFGVLGALEGNGGVEGIVPQGATFLLMPSGVQKQSLGMVTDGDNSNSGNNWFQRDIIPGSIWLIETHTPGLLSHEAQEGGQNTGECDVSLAPDAAPADPNDPYISNPCYGFLPAEANRVHFDSIQQATNFGVTVIEGAGNGGVQLDDPSIYKDEQQHVLQEDSGAVIVGASLGSNFQKHPVSNCGSKVDLFAWGQEVVTTGWMYPGSAMDWMNLPGFGQDPSDPNSGAYYVNNFRGTSSATAIIGGVAGLIQSFAKQELGSRSRYLTPAKIKEILIASGVPQAGNDCNIGVQPRVDEALRLVREFVDQVMGPKDENGERDSGRALYPELVNNQPMSAERIQSLRQPPLGVGLICADYQVQAPTVNQPEITLHPDASCNEEVIWPTGSRIAKDLDFDGDNRAELVKWTRDGGWQVDLSSVGGGEFGFGAWNVTVNNPAGLGEWVSPYAIDLDSDGRTDFVLYDRENNVWNVLYTRWSILQGSQGQWREFQYDTNDWVDDRKLDWKHSNYSRPVPGDYNGDGWVDIAIACSDGIWRIDYSDEGEFDGDFEDEDERITFLDEAKLEAAPGWAYLPFVDKVHDSAYGPETAKDIYTMNYKSPDTIARNENWQPVDEDGVPVGNGNNNPPADGPNFFYYDGNGSWLHTELFEFDNSPVIMLVDFNGDWSVDFSAKNASGSWSVQSTKVLRDDAGELVLDENDDPVASVVDLNVGVGGNIFGGSECHPTAADFDGDSLTDRAVLCPDGWTVAYSAQQGDEYISRRYTGNGMGYDADEFTVPGRVYFGGISYAKSVQLINFALQANPRQAPPIPVDMVTPFVGGD